MGQMIKSFDPIIDNDSRVLILGTIPGKVSIKKQEYYGHEKNQFWEIIYKTFGLELDNSYDRKIRFLKRRQIALWDVIESCKREGSSDSKIKNAKPNDFKKLLKQYKKIRCIFFNGAAAERFFRKHIGYETYPVIRFERLPSTSPIPGKYVKPLSEKLRDWKKILKHLKEAP